MANSTTRQKKLFKGSMMIENVESVVHISTNVSGTCEHCPKSIGGSANDFGESINHYVKEHGYQLLHVGQETDQDGGELWHHTAAVLGMPRHE